MAELPNLKGVATQDLVEVIGSGRFSASYINWSRTMQLFRDNAPGWMIETQQDQNGQVLFSSPVGADMRFRLVHLDGTMTPWFHQAVMDNRNNSIAYDKITSRDLTDTHRRGSCACLAYTTGLAYELWAKMPLESGYQVADELEIQQARKKPSASSTTKVSQVPPTQSKDAAEDAKGSKTEFVSLAKEMGLVEPAIKDLISKINENYANGIKTLKSKDDKFVLQMNERFQASEY